MVLKFIYTFALEIIEMVVLAQLVRASDCGSEGRGFEPHIPPKEKLNKNRLRECIFIEFLQKSPNNNFLSTSLF